VTYLLLLILILPCFAVSTTPGSRLSNSSPETNGVASVASGQQSVGAPAEALLNACSVVAPTNPLNLQNDTPDVQLYSDKAGVVWKTWENGQCVNIGCIPMKNLIQQFGSRENVSKVISCLPQCPSATDTDLSGAGNLGYLSNQPVSTIGMWVLRENRSLGDLPTKVPEISSADGLQIAMMLKFTSETCVVLSLDGGPLVVVGMTKYPGSIDSEYYAVDGGASTIYYYYRYQYARLDYVWDGFVLATAELWYTTGMDKRGGFQAPPRPAVRHKARPDDILLFQPQAPKKEMGTPQYSSYLSEAAVTLNYHWDVFNGNVSVGLLSTLCENTCHYLYNFTTDMKTLAEWYVYFWAGDTVPGEGYVMSFGPLKIGGEPNLHMSMLGWNEAPCHWSDSAAVGTSSGSTVNVRDAWSLQNTKSILSETGSSHFLAALSIIPTEMEKPIGISE
jgi:hypothetical protein